MAFVKLDCGILDSTLWFDRPAREVFLTALLMARPFTTEEHHEQLEVRSLDETGWSVPPGEYGFVHAAGPGIVGRSGLDRDEGMEALHRLGAPEKDSRSSDFDGRRLVRVDGGYIVLNYQKYRDKDHTNAERQRRYRERHRNTVTDESNGVTSRYVTQADAEEEVEADAQAEAYSTNREEEALRHFTPEGRTAWNQLDIPRKAAVIGELEMIVNGARGIRPHPTWADVSVALSDLALNGDPVRANLLRRYVEKAALERHNGAPTATIDQLIAEAEADENQPG